MKKNTAKVFLALTILSLTAIGIILIGGLIKNKPKEQNLVKKGSDVLGEAAQNLFNQATNSSLDNAVQNTLQNTIQNTKEVVSERVLDTEKTILKEVEKEITNLTQSQVEVLKLQICRDWGVVTVSPTPKP